MKLVNKLPVVVPMVGQDGNAFFILVRFSRAAQRDGWTKEEIDRVITEAKSGGYDHLLRVITAHTEEPEEL